MGEELTRKPKLPAGPPSKPLAPPAGGNRGNARPDTAAGNPPSPSPGTGNTKTGGSGTAAGAGKAEEKKPVGLASVTEGVPAPEAPKKKGTRKPRKKKEDPQTFNGEQIAALFLSMSAIVGSRPGMEVWTLRPEEAKQLADPIANMLAKSEKLQNAGEYADAIALATASLVIFAPRAMVYHDQQKKKKLEKTGGVQLVRTDGKKPKGGTGNERDVKPSPAPVPEYDSGILAAIPSTI